MLDLATQALVWLAASLGTRDPERVRRAVIRAAHEAVPGAVEEMLLQSHLFVGFPDTISAFALWREASGRAAPESLQEDAGIWFERGERVCAAVYGGNYSRLRANVSTLHPEMDRWMVEGGYGRVLGRPELDLATRELCIVALLVTWGAPRQLHSHLRGALNAGATPDQVQQAVNLASKLLPEDRVREVGALWRRIRSRARAA